MDQKDKKKISLIVGTRPNYIKAFPVYNSLSKNAMYNLELIHTGQHYDPIVNDIFFSQLGMKKPDIQFDLESKNECSQLIEIMKKLFDHYSISSPDLIVVFGDVTSTLAGALVANKMRIKLAHVEAGLRSFDLSMPEENNRILVDSVSDYLFVTDEAGLINLRNENNKGISFFTGNTMIDTLVKYSQLTNPENINVDLDNFIILTLHRQSNVDNLQNLTKIVNVLNKIADNHALIFPIHHRTKSKIINGNLLLNKNIKLIEPLGYLDFIKYVKKSKLVITDSGGIQEETSFLGIHCITLRENTERPCTLIENGGASILSSIDNLEHNVDKYYGKTIQTQIKLWDGEASERIKKCLDTIFFLKT